MEKKNKSVLTPVDISNVDEVPVDSAPEDWKNSIIEWGNSKYLPEQDSDDSN